MGLDVHSYLLIGFSISPHDIVGKIQDEDYTCAKGHVREGLAAFCSQDGTPFIQREQTVLTTAGVKIVELLGRRMPQSAVECDSLYRDLNDWEDGWLHKASRVMYADDDDRIPMIFGKRIRDTGSHRNSTYRDSCDISFSELQGEVAKLQPFAAIFGGREIRVYVSMSVG